MLKSITVTLTRTTSTLLIQTLTFTSKLTPRHTHQFALNSTNILHQTFKTLTDIWPVHRRRLHKPHPILPGKLLPLISSHFPISSFIEFITYQNPFYLVICHLSHIIIPPKNMLKTLPVSYVIQYQSTEAFPKMPSKNIRKFLLYLPFDNRLVLVLANCIPEWDFYSFTCFEIYKFRHMIYSNRRWNILLWFLVWNVSIE